MKKRMWNEKRAIERLAEFIETINYDNHIITLKYYSVKEYHTNFSRMGNRSWGVLDYLNHYHHWHWRIGVKK